MASLDQFQRAQRVLFLDHVCLDSTATWNFTLFKSGFSRQHVCCLILILDLGQKLCSHCDKFVIQHEKKRKDYFAKCKTRPIKSSSYPASAPLVHPTSPFLRKHLGHLSTLTMTASDVFSWTNQDPRESQLFNTWGVLYRFAVQCFFCTFMSAILTTCRRP